MLCKVIVCDERLAFVVELSAGGRGVVRLEEDWARRLGAVPGPARASLISAARAPPIR